MDDARLARNAVRPCRGRRHAGPDDGDAGAATDFSLKRSGRRAELAAYVSSEDGMEMAGSNDPVRAIAEILRRHVDRATLHKIANDLLEVRANKLPRNNRETGERNFEPAVCHVSRVAEPAIVFEDQMYPGEWRIQWSDADGAIELQSLTAANGSNLAVRSSLE